MSDSNPSPPPTTPKPEKQALIIAKSFIKAYYHTLSTAPTEINKFYKSQSQISFSEECNTPSEHVAISSPTHTEFINKFQNVVINFENGSIDAQFSGDGIFLVVTGYMKLEGSGEERFVHSFFLSSEIKGGKKHFFVLNDIFRFLTEVKVEEEVKVSDEPVVIEEEEEVIEEVLEVKEIEEIEEPVEKEEFKEETFEEETFEEIIEPAIEEQLPEEEELVEENIVEEEEQAEDKLDAALFPSAKPKSPGSWASLVAGSGKQEPQQQPQPEKKPKKQTPPPEPVEKENEVKDERRSTRSRKSYEPSSLYIKNMPDDLKESDLRALFSSYGHKIVNVYIVNLYPQRGFAFVDFDSPAAVTDIMKEPRNFVINGRTLDVEKKTGERHRSMPATTRNVNGRGGRGNPPRRSSPRMRRSSSGNRLERTRSNSGRRRGRGAGRGS